MDELDKLEKAYGALMSEIAETRRECDARLKALYEKGRALHMQILEAQIRRRAIQLKKSE